MKNKINFSLSDEKNVFGCDQITIGRLVIKLTPAEQTNEKFELYNDYQKKIHHKEHQMMSEFSNFLCQTNLYEKKIVGSNEGG